MRKDLKIGMAIGAVLLVLLVVYLAVPKSADTDVAQNTELTEGQPADGEQAPTDGAADPADAVPSDSGSTGAQVAGADQPQTPADQGRDPFAPNAGGSDAQATASAGEGTNWAKLLETGEMPLRTITPPLRASNTNPPAGGTPASPDPAGSSDALAQTASEVTSGSSPDAAPTTTNSDTGPSRTSAKTSDASSSRATAGGDARTHRVAKGETFAKIAETLLGDERYYLEIEKANPDIDPRKIRPGMVINLPDISAARRSSGSSSDDAAITASGRQERELDPEKEYKVRPGESLYVIAKRIYHNSAKVDEIYELNKGVIGDDPAKVRAGMILKLPAKGEGETSESR